MSATANLKPNNIELKRANFDSEQQLKDHLIRVYGHQCWLEHFKGKIPDDKYLKEFQDLMRNRNGPYCPRNKYEKYPGQFETSEYKGQYVPKKSNVPPKHMQEPYQDLNLPFYADTVYNTSYVPKDPLQTNSYAPKNDGNPIGKFEHDTTYNTEYKGHQGQPTNLSKIQYQNIPLSDPKFDGNSTYNTNYVKHPNSKILNFAPKNDYEPCKGCNDWNTTYNTVHDGKQNKQYEKVGKHIYCPICHQAVRQK